MMDFCPAKSKTLFSPRQKYTDFADGRQSSAQLSGDDWLHVQNVLGFCWDHPQMADKCFFVLGQLFILNMFDRPKHCFGTKVFVFLPADDGFLSQKNPNVFRQKSIVCARL
jgi:hypothetical protein